MTITLRSVKGTALNQAELDGNFTDLDGRVTTLQSGGTGITKTGTPADNQIAVWTGANSLEGTTALSLTGTLALPLLEVRSTDSGTVVGPSLRLYRLSSSPANNDNLAEVLFVGRNTTGAEDIVYARIHSEIANATQDQETGRLFFQLPVVGSGGNEVDLLKLGPDTDMVLLSTKSDAGASPSIIVDRASPDPAVGDSIGQIVIRGRDSTGATNIDYVQLKGTIADPVTGTGPDGTFQIRPMVAGTSTTVLEVSAVGAKVLTGILGLPSGATGSRPTASSAGAGAAWYDTTLGQPVYSNGSTWADALRGKLAANLDAAGFTIFGNRPQGIIVPGNLTLVAATHNGAVLRCSAAGSQTITWPNIGDFACMVYADKPVGQTVTIAGTHATNVATIQAGCCATLVQTTSNTQNVWVSDPRTVVSA